MECILLDLVKFYIGEILVVVFVVVVFVGLICFCFVEDELIFVIIVKVEEVID